MAQRACADEMGWVGWERTGQMHDVHETRDQQFETQNEDYDQNGKSLRYLEDLAYLDSRRYLFSKP